MDATNIKIGATYYTPAKVIGINQYNQPQVRVLNHDIYCFPHELHPIPSEPPTLVGTNTPKHDPCRRFRKGDIVEPVERLGRKLRLNAGRYRIDKDEVDNRVMMPHCETGFSCAAIDTVYLELVTPVEELEPYSVETCQYGYTVNKGELILATYNDETHPNAKEAAEAERDRLNAEWRKENEK